MKSMTASNDGIILWKLFITPKNVSCSLRANVKSNDNKNLKDSRNITYDNC